MRLSKHSLRLARIFRVPREKLFAAWTQEEALKKWWAPEGLTTPRIEMDFKIGGGYRIKMRPSEGESFYLNGEFVKIHPPERLVYTFQWERELELSKNLGDAGIS